MPLRYRKSLHFGFNLLVLLNVYLFETENYSLTTAVVVVGHRSDKALLFSSCDISSVVQLQLEDSVAAVCLSL